MSINECNSLLSIYGNGCDQKNFFDYVFDKITAKDIKNRFVEKKEKEINIMPFDSPGVKVIPIHKELDLQNLDIADEMKQAKEIVHDNDEFQTIYFVYPKSGEFKRHIEVKDRELEASSKEYKIKLIPYSLESLVRKKGCCSGTKCC
eukprot:Anaeramoba_flamelloidesa1058892_491.p2 GENE.a1058892_491~~a1058892_491.p2  ORF type:complete len:147 (+),score=10.10 a1058892_491:506-946(+)